ncbi:MAG: dihydroorotate dehydrogenase electron transfer subunit, partial [Oscillospiraceae bacterium]|nr:dihydroorotate dehydrogenase electron transfer subunit [Candidatus Equicaccousia limihippi]
MKQGIFEITENTALNPLIYKMVLRGDTSGITACGQFINILIEGKYLRRPISVCDYGKDTVTIIYKVVGEG